MQEESKLRGLDCRTGEYAVIITEDGQYRNRRWYRIALANVMLFFQTGFSRDAWACLHHRSSKSVEVSLRHSCNNTRYRCHEQTLSLSRKLSLKKTQGGAITPPNTVLLDIFSKYWATISTYSPKDLIVEIGQSISTEVRICCQGLWSVGQLTLKEERISVETD